MPYCRVCCEFKPKVDFTVLCSRYPDEEWTEQCCYDCSDEKYEKDEEELLIRLANKNPVFKEMLEKEKKK